MKLCKSYKFEIVFTLRVNHYKFCIFLCSFFFCNYLILTIYLFQYRFALLNEKKNTESNWLIKVLAIRGVEPRPRWYMSWLIPGSEHDLHILESAMQNNWSRNLWLKTCQKDNLCGTVGSYHNQSWRVEVNIHQFISRK